MKYVWRLAFVGVFLAPIAKADVTLVAKRTAQLKAFENLDQKLESLEDYSVAYIEGKKKTFLVMRSVPARQKAHDQMSVELRPANGKS